MKAKVELLAGRYGWVLGVVLAALEALSLQAGFDARVQQTISAALIMFAGVAVKPVANLALELPVSVSALLTAGALGLQLLASQQQLGRFWHAVLSCVLVLAAAYGFGPKLALSRPPSTQSGP